MPAGSAGNVAAALASFFVPGLGQLVQGRAAAAFGFGGTWLALWLFALAGGAPLALPLIVCLALWATVEAARWDPDRPAPAARPGRSPSEARAARRQALELVAYSALGLGGTALALWWLAGG